MFKSLSLLIIASLAVLGVRAADNTTPDISVAGDSTRTLTPLGPITPDISVIGGGQMTSVPIPILPTPDASVVGEWTTTADAAGATQTECYSLFETDGVTGSITAQPTITDGTNPPGYECYLVYAYGGGVVHVPLDSASPTAAPVAQRNLVLTVALPIIVTVLGLAAIIGAAVIFTRLRARRATAAKRSWFHRPGGWVKDNVAGKMEAGTDNTDKF